MSTSERTRKSQLLARSDKKTTVDCVSPSLYSAMPGPAAASITVSNVSAFLRMLLVAHFLGLRQPHLATPVLPAES